MYIFIKILMSGFSGDTFILMNDCTIKKAKNIKVGDKIMGHDSKPKTITKLFNGNDQMYNIVPIKGKSYCISKNHPLILKASNMESIRWDDKRNRYLVSWLERSAIKNKSISKNKFNSKKEALTYAKKFLKNEVPKIKEYTKYGQIIKMKVYKYITLPKSVIRNAYKGFSAGVSFKEKEIEVDPYILGYWLGDGTSAKPDITTAEKEVVEYFKEFASNNNLVVKQIGNKKYGYSITTGKKGKKGKNYDNNMFLCFLRNYKLLNNKHIPDDYKYNTRENRLKILAGLIDSDGYQVRNCYDFTLKSEKLVDDIIFLARSLGFKCFKKQVQKTCTNSKNGPVTGTYFRFFIYGSGLEEIPSILPRKKCHKRLHKKNASVTGFKVTESKETKYYGFEIDDKDKRILLDDFTVVHI